LAACATRSRRLAPPAHALTVHRPTVRIVSKQGGLSVSSFRCAAFRPRLPPSPEHRPDRAGLREGTPSGAALFDKEPSCSGVWATS